MSLTNITRVLGSRNGALPTVRGKIKVRIQIFMNSGYRAH
jgi:hypothetical protein